MGQLTSHEAVNLVERFNGAPINIVRRSLIKSGIAVSILALWHSEPLGAKEAKMSENI
jgi:hypothetical protein